MDIIRNSSLPWLEMKINRDEPEYSRRRHSHEELSLGIIECGRTVIEIREQRYTLHPCDAIFIPGGIIHLCSPHKEEIFRFRMLYFDASWFEKSFSQPSRPLCPAAGKLPRPLYEHILRLSRKLTDTEDPPDPFEMESEMIPLLGNILMHLDSFHFPEITSNAELGQLKTVMDKDFKKELTLEYLSHMAGMSTFSFIRAFKKQFNLSPHAYIINKRIEFCRQSLKKGNKAMTDIALEAGFTDQSHFIKTFRQYVGTLPGEYR